MSFNNFVKLLLSLIIGSQLILACEKENELSLLAATNNKTIHENATSRTSTNSCYTLVFPITLLFPDGGRARIANQIALDEFLAEWSDWYTEEGEPRLRFPVRVKRTDGSRTRINNQNEFDALEESCHSLGEEDNETTDDGEDTGEEDNETTDDGEDTTDTNDGNNNNGSAPTMSWFTAYNGSKEESHGHYILTCADGGYLQVGETGFIPNSAKLLVVKTDSNGNLLWKKEFGSAGHNLGNSALEVSDGYLIAGALNENSTLIKLNKTTGRTIYTKTYDMGGSDAIEHLALTANGIASVGYQQAADRNNTFFTEGQSFLLLLDSQGNRLRSKSLNAYMAHAYRIKAYQNELIVAGLTADAADYTVLKMDFSGTIRWHKTYGGNNQDHCFGLDLGRDGSIFLTGHTLSNTQNWDTYTMKLSNNGELLWQQKKGNPRGFDPRYIHDEAWGIKATSDGGCIVVAGTGDEYAYSACNASACSDTWAVYLVKYDAAGTMQWQSTYANEGTNSWAGEDIDLTADGGAIVGVDNGQFGFLKISAF